MLTYYKNIYNRIKKGGKYFMASAIDITNQKFGKLLVLKRAGSVNNRAT